jgi:hypothetical protein
MPWCICHLWLERFLSTRTVRNSTLDKSAQDLIAPGQDPTSAILNAEVLKRSAIAGTGLQRDAIVGESQSSQSSSIGALRVA